MHKPRKIFVTYGDYEWQDAKRRIKREARSLHLFDKIIAYSPKDLPDEVKHSPLYPCKKGGGYWIWKPYVIRKTVERYPDATVFYCDAGCTLLDSPKWEELYRKSLSGKAILCRYDDDGVCLSWQRYFGCGSAKVKHWTKSATLDFFNASFSSGAWSETNIIFGGFMVMGGGNTLLDEWIDLTAGHPELVRDPEPGENNNPDMVQHRHDQCLLTALAWKHREDRFLEVVDEHYMYDAERPFLANRRKYCPGKLKRLLYPVVHAVTGESIFRQMKDFLKKRYNG